MLSGPHFSIYDICYTLENTRSFNARATHFNNYCTDFIILVVMVCVTYSTTI